MLNIIAIVTFLIGIIGIGIIVARKASLVAAYVPQEVSKPSFMANVKGRFSLKPVSNELILHKFLSKVRILVLKTDNKTSEWMRRLREKSVQNKTKFSDNYWEKLKK